MRLLIVDDDQHVGEIYRESLISEGYAVDTADTAEEAENLGCSIPYDLILLDVVLPDGNGFEVCRKLRQIGVQAPIMLISGKKKDEVDIIQGLDCGANEYLTKPVTPGELAARVSGLLRMKHETQALEIQVGDILVNTVSRQVRKKGEEVILTRKEYAVFEYLLYHPGDIVTRAEFEEHVWGVSLDTSSNLVDVHIKNLRAKLGDVNQTLIETVRGRGYRLRRLDADR